MSDNSSVASKVSMWAERTVALKVSMSVGLTESGSAGTLVDLWEQRLVGELVGMMVVYSVEC